jgi:hypothetical protein
MPAMWLLLQGLIFIAVVLFFPDGVVALWDSIEKNVSRRAGILAIAVSALPLLAIALFVMLEAMGIMPDLLQRVVFESDKVGHVSLKYIVLIVMIALGAIASRLLALPRNEGNVEPVAPPPFVPATAATLEADQS